jgi:hypothetical protein
MTIRFVLFINKIERLVKCSRPALDNFESDFGLMCISIV